MNLISFKNNIIKFFLALSSPITRNLFFCILFNALLILPTALFPLSFPPKRYWIFNFGLSYLILLADELLRTKGRLIKNSESEFLPKIRRTLRAALLIVTGGIALTDIFLIFHFNAIINTYIFQLVAATNAQESSEFINTYLLTSKTFLAVVIVLVCIVCSYAVYWTFKYLFTICSNNVKNIIIASLVVICSFSAVKCITLLKYFGTDYANNWKYSYLTKQPFFSIVNSCWQFAAQKSENDELLKACQNISIEDSVTQSASNIVVIFGESFNKHHSSLYGYDKGTNPKLGAIEGIAVFTDVVACTNSTIHVLNNAMSLSSIGDDSKWCEKPLFPAIFREYDYFVTFWSNQYTMDINQSVWDSSWMNVNEISSLNYDSRNDEKFKYDLELLSDYIKERQIHGNELIIFQLMGSHVARKDRFPNDWAEFAIDDYDNNQLSDKQKQEIADYDNSILYNDYVVSEIIKYFSKEDAIIIYLSDHGEETYDFRDYLGRAFDFTEFNGQVLRNQVEIPFMIYMTDTYKSNHPDIAKAVYSSVDRPFMTDDLPHLLFEVSGLDCPYFIPSKSLINENYDTTRKRTILSPYTLELVDYDKFRAK